MKVIAAALLTLLSTYTVTGKSDGKSKSGKSKSGVECNQETIQGLWQYTTHDTGTPWNAYIGCTSSGVPAGTVRCQMFDQPDWKRDDCTTIAYFDPDYISINENGYCSFGYNGKGLLVLQDVKAGECESDCVKEGKYMAKGQLTSGGILELLFSDDGGSSFYNEGEARLALNAAH